MSSNKLTIKEVAGRLNVSTATISNAFNRPDQLSKKKRAAILAACNEMGYFGPNKAARSLRKGKSNIIALVLPDSLDFVISDPVASRLVEGIASVLKSTDTHLLLFSGNRDSLNEVIDFVDGFICYGAPRNQNLLDQISIITKRVVTIDFNIPGVPSVNIDNVEAAYQSACQAIQEGAKRPAILGLRLIDSDTTSTIGDKPLIDSEYSISHRRLDGYLNALSANNIAIDNSMIWHIPESSHFYAVVAAKEALSSDPPPDVLLCMSDIIALSAMQEALKIGLRIPQDIRIVGFDGIDEARRYHPTLATVQQNSVVKGETAAKLFFTQESDNIQLPFELVDGDSAP